MKKLLYIGSTNFEDNLFATPCLELLSKEYEIYILLPELIGLFPGYSFIKRVFKKTDILSDNVKLQLKKLFPVNEDNYWAYHDDKDADFITKNSELAHIKNYNVLTDAQVRIISETNSTGFYLTNTRKYLLKLQLMQLPETVNFDCTIRVPVHTKLHSSKDVIIYQGAEDVTRQLSAEVIEKFIKRAPNSIFLVTADTASNLNLAKRDIRYIVLDPQINFNFNKIAPLFKTSPRVFIGPEGLFTHLAIAYRVPVIWLQSRNIIENRIDSQCRSFCKVYAKNNLTCTKECLACKLSDAVKTGSLPYGLIDAANVTTIPYEQMPCYVNSNPDCLKYTDTQVDEILSLTYANY